MQLLFLLDVGIKNMGSVFYSRKFSGVRTMLLSFPIKIKNKTNKKRDHGS